MRPRLLWISLFLLTVTGCEKHIIATIVSVDKVMVEACGEIVPVTAIIAKSTDDKTITLGDRDARREWKVGERYCLTYEDGERLGGFPKLVSGEQTNALLVKNADEYMKHKLEADPALKQRLVEAGSSNPIPVSGPAESTTITVEGQETAVMIVDDKGSIRINSNGTIDVCHADGHSEYGVKKSGPFLVKLKK